MSTSVLKQVAAAGLWRLIERMNVHMKHTMAIIGYGGMGGWHHKSISEKIPELLVKGAYDIREEAAEKAREDGLYAYGSLEELRQDGSVELVTVATPNHVHKDLVIACLRAGKNVVCEKPVAMNTEELREMIAAADETGKLFTVHHNRRWDRDYRIVKTILADGTIGRPYFIESRVQGSRGAMHGWRGYKVNGGGMVLDWGVHLVDQLLDMTDSPVVSVDAHLLSVFTPEVEDNIKILLRFENGLSALCEMSTNCFVNLPRWHVSGTDGTAVVEGWGCHGKIVKLDTDEKMEWADDIVYTEAGPTRTMAPRPVHTTKELPLPDVQSDWSDYYRNIVEVLEGRAKATVQLSQVLRVMKVIDTVFASAEAGHGLSCYI